MAALERALVLALLAAVVAGAFALRERHRAGYERPPAEARAGPIWLVDDPDAAYHLRRVELALASGHVPLFDRYLAHPEGSAVPWPPLFDAALARAASTFRPDAGDPQLGGHEEALLEARLVHVPPLLGALTAAAVFLAVLAFAGRGAGWAALVAAAIYASAPIAVWYGEVTRVDHHVAVALGLALQLACVAWSARARDLTDATLGAILAGLVGGLVLLTWLAGAVFFLAGGVAFLVKALARDEARARDGARAGLFLFLVAAVVTLVPASQSPWNAVQPGSLVNLTSAVPLALLVAALPFALLLWSAPRRLGRPFALALALAAAAGGALALPGFVDGVREGLRWASRGELFMDVVDESRPLFGRRGELGWRGAVADLGPFALAFPVAWLAALALALRRGAPARLGLVALAALLAAMTLSQRRFGNSFSVLLACTVGVALADVGALVRARIAVARGGRLAAAAAVAGLLALALVPAARALRADRSAVLADVRAWRGEIVDGLRWMRTNTPEPGPWNAPAIPQEWGVLSAWGLGHLVEYHARRPSIATNFGSYVGERGFRESAAALLESDPAELARRMHALGARYVVVTPRQANDLASLARIAGYGGAERAALFERTPAGKTYSERARASAVWRLALYPADAAPDAYPGLERVWSARRRETPRGTPPRPGELSGPVLSIYRLARERSAAPPSLRAR